MRVFELEGLSGAAVWRRAQQNRSLLANCRAIEGLSGSEQRRAKVELITFLTSLSFDSPPDVVGIEGTRVRRFGRLTAHNPRIYRLRLSRRQRALAVWEGRRRRLLRVGRLDGYTTVMPFRDPAAFQEFVESEMAPVDVQLPMLARYGQCTCLYVGGVFHLPSIARSRQLLSSSTLLMLQLFRHVAQFLPPPPPEAQTRPAEVAAALRYPRLVCLPWADETRALMDGLGFEFYGRTWEQDDKYVLDLSDFAKPGLDAERRQKLTRALATLQYALHRSSKRGYI